MKPFLFFITIFGLLLIGTKNPVLASSPEEYPCFDAPVPTTTVTITLDFGPTSCPDWCCYAWEIRTYEKTSGGTVRLIDTRSFDCSRNTYQFNATLDNGYRYIKTVVVAIASSVCIPAPPYQNWDSGWWDYQTYGNPGTWYPEICG